MTQHSIDQVIISIAELVCAEKEHSDWLPERSEFSFKQTACKVTMCLRGANCFNFDKKQSENVLVNIT